MSTRSAPGVLILLMTAALTLLPPAAHGAEPGAEEGTASGWLKVVAYATCALAVFHATTPADWLTAAATCSKLFVDEPSSPAGGA